MRTSTKKQNYILEQHDMMDGSYGICKTRQNGNIYQFFMWIDDEKKMLRKTLRTSHLEDAKEKGKDLFLTILSRKNDGKNYFGLTVKQGIEKYLKFKQMEVDSGMITQGRHICIKSHLKHFHSYLCERKYETDKSTGFYFAKVNLKDLHRRSFLKYFHYRKTKSKGLVEDITLKNEQCTINSLVRYLHDEGEMDFIGFDFPKLKLPNNRDKTRRSTFTIDEYKKLTKELRSYCGRKKCRNESEHINKQVLRHFILIAANTGLRIRELRCLKWNDIIWIKNIKGKKYVKLAIRGETSKTSKDRMFVTRGGEYFERLRRISHYSHQLNYVFQTEEETRFSKRIIYGKHWDNLMNKIGISNWKERKLTYYSLRHFYVTMRILSGCSYSDVAQMCGNSTAQIEKTYYHVSEQKMITEATRDFVVDEEVIKRVA